MKQHLNSIAEQFDGPVADSLKDRIGETVAGFFKSRTKSLYRKPTAQAASVIDRAIMCYLKKKAVVESRPRFLERLHADFWRGQGGSEFADNCEHRFDDMFLARQQQELALLRRFVQRRFTTRIVEIGCSSGLMLNYLTKQLSCIEQSYGIDINDAQIARNKHVSYFDPRIKFVCDDAVKWIAKNPAHNTLFVSNGGVMEYLRQDVISGLLRDIGNKSKNSIFFAVEPIAADHNFASSPDSIPFGSEHSFSHNYRRLFIDNGFDIVFQRTLDFEEWRMVSTIAVNHH